MLHAQQCYHRDIAPDNILVLAGKGQPLLLDFGAARRVIGDMTQALTVILKPGYAPIEQYAESGGMKQGPWTDVYALGAVVYHAIARRAPPPAVARVLLDDYQPLEQLAAGRYSSRFLQAIDQALAVRPEHRLQTIAQFREALGLGMPLPTEPLVTVPGVERASRVEPGERLARTGPGRTEPRCSRRSGRCRRARSARMSHAPGRACRVASRC